MSGGAPSSKTPSIDDLILATADDELLMGHHWSEWICVAPFLEEDLAVSSIGQDELGHAHALYALLTDDIDTLALRRSPTQYRSAWLCELPTPDWADALVRHLLYDIAEDLRWEGLAAADPVRLGGLADQARREERYHRRHATSMVERLLSAGGDSRTAIEESMERLAPLAAGLFEDMADLYGRFTAAVDELLRPHALAVDWPTAPPSGQGRAGLRSEHFESLHRRLNAVIDLDPSAAW
jgi:ring-1,2-phenylacetyl-CoA epoxidase subunit PaaC